MATVYYSTGKPGKANKVVIIVCAALLALCIGALWLTGIPQPEKEERRSAAYSEYRMYEAVGKTIAYMNGAFEGDSEDIESQIANWREKWPDFDYCVAAYSHTPEYLEILTQRAKADYDAANEALSGNQRVLNIVAVAITSFGIFDLLVLIGAIAYRTGTWIHMTHRSE